MKRIKHSGKVDLLHEGCARDLLAATANPPFKLPDLGPDRLDEHGAPLAAPTSPLTNSRPEALSPAPPGELASLHPENAVKAVGQVPSPRPEPKLADAGGMTGDQPSIPDDLSIPEFLRR